MYNLYMDTVNNDGRLSELALEYSKFIQKSDKKAQYVLTPDDFSAYKKYKSFNVYGLDALNPFDIIPSPSDEFGGQRKFLLGTPKSSSEMNQDQLNETLSEAKKRPWEIYKISKFGQGDQTLHSIFTIVECIQNGDNKGNHLDFIRFNAWGYKDLLDVMPSGAYIDLPYFMLAKSGEILIDAVNKKQIKLIKPGIITGTTNEIFARFIQKRIGVKPVSTDGIEYQFSVPFDQLASKFEELSNNPASQKLVNQGQMLFENALKKVPEFLDKFTGTQTDKVIGFWDWYYTQK